MIATRKARKKTLLATISLFLLLPLAGWGDEDVEQLRVRFVQDSSTDRQPAQTAFPTYPSIARRDRIEGEATVCFNIDARGRIKNVRIRDYSHKIFRRPAIRAAKKSTFEPLMPGQLLAKAKACRTYRFRLEPIETDESAENQAAAQPREE